MPIDPSISLQAGQGVTPLANPLDTYGKVATLANTLSQNRLIDASAQNAVDQNRNIRLQGDTSAQALGSSQQSAINSAALSLIKLPDDQIGRATYQTLDNLVKSNVITQDQAKSFGDVIAQTGNGTTDPAVGAAHLRQTLYGYAMRGLPQGAQFEQVQGQNAQPTNGASTFFGKRDMNTGAFIPATSMQQQLTPVEQNTIQQIPQLDANSKPTGATQFATGRQVALANGNGGLVPGGSATSAPSAFPQGFTGRPAVAGGSTTPAPAPVAPPVGTLGATQVPGQAGAMQEDALAATKAGNAVYAAADAAPARKAQYNTMLDDLRNITTGPGSENIARAEAMLQKYAGFGVTMTPQELASSEGFAKISKQIALGQAGALGVGTDQKLTTAMGANPSRDLSKMGNTQIIAMLKGNEDALIAKAQAWDKWKTAGNNPSTYNQFQTQFNKTFDPRVYQYNNMIQTMTPAEKKSYVDGLPDKGESLKANYNKAVDDGLLKPGG